MSVDALAARTSQPLTELRPPAPAQSTLVVPLSVVPVASAPLPVVADQVATNQQSVPQSTSRGGYAMPCIAACSWMTSFALAITQGASLPLLVAITATGLALSPLYRKLFTDSELPNTKRLPAPAAERSEESSEVTGSARATNSPDELVAQAVNRAQAAYYASTRDKILKDCAVDNAATLTAPHIVRLARTAYYANARDAILITFATRQTARLSSDDLISLAKNAYYASARDKILLLQAAS